MFSLEYKTVTKTKEKQYVNVTWRSRENLIFLVDCAICFLMHDTEMSE